VTGANILIHVGKGVGSGAEQTWAGLCAAAINAAIDTALEGNTPTTEGSAELTVSALTDGAALFNSKAAPNGVVSFGPDQEVVRLGADILRATGAVLTRQHPTARIGIG
jgi:hypothetical protein